MNPQQQNMNFDDFVSGLGVSPQAAPMPKPENDFAERLQKIYSSQQESARPLGAARGFTTGAVKGALGTFVESPIRSIAGIAATGEAVRGKGTEEQLVSQSKELDALTNQLATATGEQKAMLQQQIRQKMSELQGKSEAFKQQTAGAQKFMDIEQGKSRLTEALQPKTTAESLGYGAEKLAEFFIPSGKALEASRVARGVVEGSKMAKFGELTKAFGAEGVDKIAGALARGATYTGKILGPAAVEALTAAGVSMAQTRDPEEAVRNAEWAGAITGGIGVLSSMGNPFVNAAKRIYRAALKPSTAGGIAGAERAARAVETGLDEGIKLTEKGINKTVATIDAMESQLDDAIKAAAAQGDKTSVPTAPLREYINEAKQWFQYLADTDAAQKALDDIDNIYDNFVNVYGENVPIDVAQKIKTSTYRYLKEAFNEIAAPAKEGSKQLVRGLKEGIVENAPAVGDINARLRKLYEFDEVLEKSVGRIQNRNLLGLGTKGIAVAAGATGNPLLGALAFANEFITSPGIGSSAAIKLYRLGKVLNTMDASLAERAIESPTMANVIRRITRNYGDMSQEEQKAAQGILGWFERTKKQATELLSDRRGSIDFGAEVFPKGEAAATAKTTANLAEEAKKYSSAEEFVRSRLVAEYSPLDAQNTARAVKLLNESGVPVKSGEDIITLYHGTNAKGMKGITESGTINPFSYLATDKNASARFAFGNKGGILEIKVLVKDAGYVQQQMAGTKGATIQNPIRLVRGEDGIWRAEKLPTKSQLTDIWNKAHK